MRYQSMLPAMSSEDHRRPKLIMNILTILGMAIATAAVTLLCIRFGTIVTKTPIQTGNVYHTTDDRSITHDRGKLLIVTIPPDTAVGLNTTDGFISRDQHGTRISLPGSTFMVSENQSMANYSSFKHLQQDNGRSLSDIGLVQADGYLAESSTSKIVDRPIDLWDTSNQHNRNGNIATIGDKSENNDEYVTVDTNMHQINGRQISRRKMNHYHQLNTNTAKYATMTDEDDSNGYQNTYDLTYNVGDYGHKEYDNPTYEAGWTSTGHPEQAQGSLWSESSGSWEPPPYGKGEGYLVDQGPSRKPLDRPSSSPTNKDLNSLLNNVSWKTISILTLFKLVFAKLQAIGFLSTLLQLGFSFKLFMTAVFFNFLSIMKLMKFFKILLLPLLLAQLLPFLIQLLMMPGRLLDLMRRMNSNNIAANQNGGLLLNQPGGLLTSQQGGVQSGGILPNQQGATRPSSIQRDSMVRATGKDIPTSQTTVVDDNIAGKTNDSLLKLEAIHLTDVQSDESTQLSDPTLEIFQKLLDSEKCVERIACQISVAEKTGNVPIWINWMLHRLHTFISNDKLESYLMAYKNVNDEIHAKSSIPDNWVTWCLERYNCNNSDNTTNVSNAKQ